MVCVCVCVVCYAREVCVLRTVFTYAHFHTHTHTNFVLNQRYVKLAVMHHSSSIRNAMPYQSTPPEADGESMENCAGPKTLNCR